MTAGQDALIGRMGGDEFALAVLRPRPGRARPAPGRRARRGRRRRTRPCEPASAWPSSRADGHDAESVLRAGDVALRVAKRTGSRHRVSLYAGGSLLGAAAAARRPTSTG